LPNTVFFVYREKIKFRQFVDKVEQRASEGAGTRINQKKKENQGLDKTKKNGTVSPTTNKLLFPPTQKEAQKQNQMF